MFLAVVFDGLPRSFTDDEDDEEMEEEDVSTKDRKEFFRSGAASAIGESHTRPTPNSLDQVQQITKVIFSL